MLNSATTSASGYQRVVISQIKQRGENSRLCNRMDMDSIKSLLSSAESDFAAMGLDRLEKESRTLLKELTEHGPEGPPLTRLLDNVYGRVWETELNSALVNDMPPKVLESARTMRGEFAKVVTQLPDELISVVCEESASISLLGNDRLSKRVSKDFR